LFVEENAYRACVFPFIFQRSVYTGCTLRQVEELIKCHVPLSHVFFHSSHAIRVTNPDHSIGFPGPNFEKEVYGTVSLKDTCKFTVHLKGTAS
jgi:hypothetical protein